MDDMSCDMEYVDDIGSDIADTPVLDDMLGVKDVEYDASDIDYDEVAEYYPDEVDISEDYEDVGDMEPDVREDYEEQDISDELNQMLDEWEEMGEDEDPEVYEYVKKKDEINSYEMNGYSYEKDDEGRIILAEGDLRLEQGVRDTSAQLKAGGEFRRDTDDGGHLIGSRFGGSGELNNLIAQNRFINRSAYKTFENTWADELERGNEVHVEIEPYYQDNTKRPHAIMGRYTITDQRGQKQEEVFSLTNENLNEEEFELSEEADDI